MAKTLTPAYQALIASKYWEDTALADMNEAQWEAICDGCAKCCLHKFIDDDDVDEVEFTEHVKVDGEEMHFTNIACQYLHTKTCGCSVYDKRTELVPQCVKLTQDNLPHIFYMPPSCSYRRLHEGKGLADWHPLLNKGKKTQMHTAGISVRGKTISELDADMAHFEDYIVVWPLVE
ncbi:MAG: YcgN family cysteine cluster protein [Glaciecola sp.]|jgi:uncharacterized cysteine cluster protein YcgN (CxxCxxCC family)